MASRTNRSKHVKDKELKIVCSDSNENVECGEKGYSENQYSLVTDPNSEVSCWKLHESENQKGRCYQDASFRV